MICQHCSAEIPQGSQFCGSCGGAQGASLHDDVPKGGTRCIRCGADLPSGIQFCGLCGSQQATTGTELGLLPESPARVVAKPRPVGTDGALDLGFPFPVTVWQGLDQESADAYEVYQSCFAQQWGGYEEFIQFGYLLVRGGISGLSQEVATGAKRANLAFTNFMSGARAGGKVHSPKDARYFYRDSILRSRSPGIHSRYRVFQQTYMRSMRIVRARRNVTYYPPAPVANLVVAVLPDRVKGKYACNVESQQFVAKPSGNWSQSLADHLNQTLLPVALDLWSGDFDVFGGDTYTRGNRHGAMTNRWAAIEDGDQALEPIFSPTLFQTDVINPATWYQDTTQRRPTDLRAREFAIGIVPSGTGSLLIVQYPTPSVYDRRGSLVETRMRLDMVAWMIEAVATFVAHPECSEDGSGAMKASDYHSYFSAVDAKRMRSGSVHRNNPGDQWLANEMGRWMTHPSTNRPVLPVEMAYRACPEQA